MKKFTKGMLATAGCFLGIGIVLGCIGAIGGSYMDKKAGNTENFSLVRDAWHMVRGWDLRWRRGGESGFTLFYDGIEFDKGHDIVYGSFTDDGLRSEDVRNLKLEIGGGTLALRSGDHMELKKAGGPECQYYIEGNTFYLKQKMPVAGGKADLTLTLPEGMSLQEVDIEMGAGKVITKDLLTAEQMDLEIAAGEITMEQIEAGYFTAEAATGSLEVQRLDARDCDMEVSMGNITIRNGLITGDLDAEVNMGNIDISLRDSYENHDYEVDCDMGEITITPEDGKTKEFSGFPSTIELSGRNSAGGSMYDLACNMGNIAVKFSGKEKGGGADAAGAADAKIEAGGTAEEGMPAEETGETGESPLAEEMPERDGGLPGLEDIYSIEDNWPESIGRVNENTTAEDFSFEIWISEPMALSVSCVTEKGEMDLEIENEKGKDIFEKDDIRTGTYVVNVDSAGTYRVRFECENHTGSFWIRPED